MRVAAVALGLGAVPGATTGASAETVQGSAILGTDGWISHRDATATRRPVVLEFRRALDLARKPKALRVAVSADNAFVLYVNGIRVGSGPSTSDRAHWHYSAIDLAPYLRSGHNVVTATVWNFVKPSASLPPRATEAQKSGAYAAEMMSQTGRLAQQSVATGFWLSFEGEGAPLSTGQGGWDVRIDTARSASSGPRQLGLQSYYVGSAPEQVDTRIGTGRPGSEWTAAVAAPAAARPLTADTLPSQRFALVAPGMLVRATGLAGSRFPTGPVTVPANSRATLLLRRDAMISAYPELAFSGGRDARIKLTYGEALVDAAGHKGDRDAMDGRHIVGISDTVIADGASRRYLPLWWRTWRYMEIGVETGPAPLTLDGLRVWETGYPFEQHGYFRSNDPQLDRIWQVGWRTALVDAHDTYMDSSYWEQLQYVGDTRLQALISYAVSGDARLAAQAIDAFAASDVKGGLVEGAWPSRGTNSIATFSLLWVGMLHDWWREQPDTGLVVRNLPRMRTVLQWFEKLETPSGLLRKGPEWYFVDWVGQTAGDRTVFPSYARDGTSCLTSIHYLGALDQAAELEAALGDPALGRADKAKADALRTAIRARCYSASRKLFADNPDLAVFSQQMNVLAVLYDVIQRDEARALLGRVTVPGGGIDAPTGMFPLSYYFAWYLVRAFEHAGMADRYPQLLGTWRNLLKLNYTTWPEERGNTRSDSHAWSAHPTADLLRLVAGIGPAAPGYAQVRIAPELGPLTKLDAAAMTPQGLITVRYRVANDRLRATITKPAALPGWFEWQGQRYPLTGRGRTLVLASPSTNSTTSH